MIKSPDNFENKLYSPEVKPEVLDHINNLKNKLELLANQVEELKKEKISNDRLKQEIALKQEMEIILKAILESKKKNIEVKFIDQQIEKIQEIMGEKEVMGPDQIKKAFGIEIAESEIPDIPFSEAELERAKELGQFLVLRVNKAQDGQALNMLKMHEILTEDFSKKGAGKVLFDTADWKEKEPFYTNETPSIGWALTSKEVIPDSTSKNYLEQTEEIAQYLEAEVFNSTEMSTEYKEAIEELKDKKEELNKLIETGDEPELSKLKLNKLTRQSPVEALYDILIYFQNNNERLLEKKCTWTHTVDSDGLRVVLGFFVSGGPLVDRYPDGNSGSVCGVLLSRKS
jgi:hypothetical protein